MRAVRCGQLLLLECPYKQLLKGMASEITSAEVQVQAPPCDICMRLSQLPNVSALQSTNLLHRSPQNIICHKDLMKWCQDHKEQGEGIVFVRKGAPAHRIARIVTRTQLFLFNIVSAVSVLFLGFLMMGVLPVWDAYLPFIEESHNGREPERQNWVGGVAAVLVNVHSRGIAEG